MALTQDEVIRIAQEAGFVTGTINYTGAASHAFVRPLVGINCLTELTKVIQSAYEAGAKAENEACAKVCEEMADNAWSQAEAQFGGFFADAIRERRK